ncbi:MAG: 3'(2'),5'-bisphosphate nucleotidase CysQ [Campylobacter sp.]|nr:3'(2'),5'-bisphosphate nucleotidase CysQ [Campylobacter sp.]
MKFYLELAKEAAIKASLEIKKHYDDFESWQKSDKSPVTSADLAANQVIIQNLEPSGFKICSEERILNYDELKNEDYFWVVDPLDGTKNFIRRDGGFSVCIALVKNDTPVLGVIMIPQSNEIFYNDNNTVYKEIYADGILSQKQNLCEAKKENFGKIYIGAHKASPAAEALSKEFGFEIIRVGSAIKYCRICEGGGIYVRFYPSSLWDNAAGEALLRTAGGEVLSVKDKKPIDYSTKNGLICPNFIAIGKELLDQKDKICSILEKID